MEGKDRLDRMAELVALRAQQKLGKKAGLRVVTSENLHKVVPGAPKPNRLDPITRESHLRRIRWIARIYRLGWLVDQHVFGMTGPDCLDDGDLLELHRELEKARECISEGISLEEVGLIRTQPL